MKKTFIFISLTLLLMSSLTGCNLPGTQISPTQSSSEVSIGTQIAQTLTAISIEVSQGGTRTPTIITSQPNQTLATTSTRSPSSTPLPSITAAINTPLPPTSIPTPCDRAQFVMDVTVDDGTNFSPGATFIKTWRIKNNGSCTWTTAYAFVFDSGNSLSGPVEVPLPGIVAPGQVVDLSVTLKAPSSAGTYQGYWKLKNAAGVRFGIGNNASGSFWIKITVGNTTTPGPSPTTGSIVSGACKILNTGPTYGAEFSPGDSFDSRWTVKNISSNSWTVDAVDFKYLGGTAFYDGDSAFDLKSQVDPDGEIDLIIDSIAPSSVGLYTMSWGLVQGSTTLCTMSVTIRVK